jgi:hypothetical protein
LRAWGIPGAFRLGFVLREISMPGVLSPERAPLFLGLAAIPPIRANRMQRRWLAGSIARHEGGPDLMHGVMDHTGHCLADDAGDAFTQSACKGLQATAQFQQAFAQIAASRVKKTIKESHGRSSFVEGTTAE